MKNYYPKLVAIVALLSTISISTFAQSVSYGKLKSLKLNSSVQNGKITLNWEAYSTINSYRVYKMSGGTWPSSPEAILSSSVTTFVDSNITTNNIYEYKVIGIRTYDYDAYGYAAVGYDLNEVTSKGLVAVIIDSSIQDDLESELATYKKDLMGDGYDVIIQGFDTSLNAYDLKSAIVTINSNYSNLTTVFLIGNLPYAYTGEMSPDGHTDHHGAWPSDMVLADIDGSYTDQSVQYTNNNNDRWSNKKHDDKNDQSYLDTDADIQVGRLDLSNLPAFNQSEVTLYKNYFNKLHAFKTGQFVPRNGGIVDDNFTSFSEGFSQNGYRNFSALVNMDSVQDADIVNTLTNSSMLWSYTCGAGTFTSINGFASTSNLSSASLNGVFSLVLGSYNADPDQANNLMRAMLANGNFLTTGWAGRPNWFLQHMAADKTIGYATKLSQNNDGLYEPTGLYARSMHVMLLGDPTLKNHYTPNVTNLYTIRNVTKDTAFLSWNAAPSALGYNIYRSKDELENYQKINSSLITGSSYQDPISADTSYYYRIESIELVASSNSYYTSSVGDYILSDYTAAPVPVTLIQFTAEQQEDKVALNWSVAQEINFSHYSVEKYNEDINTWEQIATVQPKGAQYSISNYELIDAKPVIGKNIYRLKMIDFDQSFEYSDIRIVMLENGLNYGEFDIFPLPAQTNITVTTELTEDREFREFAILNANGVETLRQKVTAQNNSIDISALPRGIYFVKDVNNLGVTKKLVISD